MRALKAPPSQWKRWKQLSYTRRKELVDVIEAAKKPETRARRIGRAVENLPGSADQGHPRTVFGEAARGRESHPATAADDDRGGVLQPEVHP